MTVEWKSTAARAKVTLGNGVVVVARILESNFWSVDIFNDPKRKPAHYEVFASGTSGCFKTSRALAELAFRAACALCDTALNPPEAQYLDQPLAPELTLDDGTP